MEPTWRLMDQFVTTVVQYALDKDSDESTQPMNYATAYPGGGAVSYVSYQKCKNQVIQVLKLVILPVYILAGSVIRMFEHFLTTEVYRTGLTQYLTNK